MRFLLFFLIFVTRIRSDKGLDKTPRLGISIVIWILSSDTDTDTDTLFVSSTNSIQIVRRQCCLLRIDETLYISTISKSEQNLFM